MKMIEKLRKMTSEVIDDLKAPFRLGMINGEFDDLIRKAAEQRIDTERALLDAYKELSIAEDRAPARFIIKRIVDLKIALEDAEALASKYEAEKAYLNSEAPKDEAK